MPRLALLLALVAASCTSLDATNVATSDMRATFRVSATGDGTTYAEAILLLVGPGTEYILVAEDETLDVTLGATTLPLDQETQGVILYSAVFDEDPPGETFTFAYTRVAWPSAPSSTVALPPMVDAIAAGPGFGPNNALSVTWDAMPGGARLSVSGDCIETWAAEVSLETGSYDVPGAEITVRPDTGSCPVEVQLFAEQVGVVDSAFDPQSSINGRAWRVASSTWTP